MRAVKKPFFLWGGGDGGKGGEDEEFSLTWEETDDNGGSLVQKRLQKMEVLRLEFLSKLLMAEELESLWHNRDRIKENDIEIWSYEDQIQFE